MLKLIIMLFVLLCNNVASAQIIKIDLLSNHCRPDYRTTINSQTNECLRLITSGNSAHPDEVVIYLHGDYGIGGSSYMGEFAKAFAKESRLNIAIIRPGYFDDAGNFSTGCSLGVSDNNIAGRLDGYTRKNVEIIADAINNLKVHYKPKKLLIIGHSGGAALGALILNEYPTLADGALLINCPCDVKLWRPQWKQSLSPIEHINTINKKSAITILSGASDNIVYPELGKGYAEALIKNGIQAQYFLGIGMAHDLSDKTTREIVTKSVQDFLK